MSTPPPPAPGFVAPPQQKSGFPWMACGIGCAVLLLIVIAVAVFIGVKAKQAFDEVNATMERAQEVAQRQNSARERIAALDEAHPPTLAEDLSRAELTDAEMRHVALRADHQPARTHVPEHHAALVLLREQLGALADDVERVPLVHDRTLGVLAVQPLTHGHPRAVL